MAAGAVVKVVTKMAPKNKNPVKAPASQDHFIYLYIPPIYYITAPDEHHTIHTHQILLNNCVF